VCQIGSPRGTTATLHGNNHRQPNTTDLHHIGQTAEGGTMANEKAKGTVNDVKGRAKRQAGEWTGDNQTQAEGAKDQAKGKIQKAAGKVKDAARNATRSDKEDVA
jgi:uncharacterized protein YjbJ (UPF0337 family)